MANKFTKQSAFLAIDPSNTGIGTDKALLGDVQLTSIWKLANMYSFRHAYGQAIPLKGIDGTIAGWRNKGSYTILKSGGAPAFAKKTDLDGYTAPHEMTKIKEVVVSCNTEIVSRVGIGGIDTIQLSNELVSNQVTSQLNELNDTIDTAFFKWLAKKLKNVAVLGQTMDKKDIASFVGVTVAGAAGIYTPTELENIGVQLRLSAGNLHRLKRDHKGRYGGEGIEGISKQSIFIDLAPSLYAAFTNHFNVATMTLSGLQGGYNIARWGSYILRENDNLADVTDGTDPVLAIIATGKTAVMPWMLVATNVGKIGNSPDVETYIEAKVNAEGGVLDKIEGKLIFNSAIMIIKK